MGAHFLPVALLATAAACGDHVVGSTHASPPLAPIDAVDASTGATLPPAGDDGGVSLEAAAPAPDAAPAPAVTCTGKTGHGGDLTLSLTSGGYARDSLLHVPAGYDPTRGSMLVLNFHGFTSNAIEQEGLTGMNGVADAKNFLVAYPDGLGNGWNAGDCCSELQPPHVDDVQFTKDLLSLLESQYCIDPARVYATGFSNGGFLSHLLACEMSDVFAAVAPVSGVLGVPLTQCTPARAVPVLDFHGTGDPVVPYDGGPALKLLPPIVFRSVDETIADRRATNACLGAPQVTYEKGDTSCVRWSDCADGADVELCTVSNGGHQWPGGIGIPGLGNATTNVDASARIVNFFLEHPMPRR